jgi:plastocyanin
MKTIRFFCLLLAMAGMLFAVTSVQAQNEKIVPEMQGTGHQVIRLNYTFGVDPAKVTIARGTTVIWMNSGRSNAKIKFTGKQVTMACKSPVHFLVDEAGSFTSNDIPPGAVASLCFVEKGAFDYTVTQETPAQNPTAAPRESKGKLIVE